MSHARYLIGDVFDRMAELPDASVDLVLTSPPFLALRSYLPADHPDKCKEIGSEPTPAEFLDTLLNLTAVWGRVLAPHGSLCVELGDTYAGSGGAGGDYADGGMREGQPKFRHVGSREHRPEREGTGADGGARVVPVNGGNGWPLDKSLCGIPHLYHLSLAYGRNLLTGEPSPAGQWRVRNVVAWCRPNPAVGALGDKFRPATSYMTIATRSRTRWFDLDAVRTMTDRHASDVEKGTTTKHGKFGEDDGRNHNHGRSEYTNAGNPAGAPPLDWWEVSTESYSGSHYATWPRKLLDRPIQAMCPRQVCTVCGEPRRRIVGDPTYVQSRNGAEPAVLDMREGEIAAPGVRNWSANGAAKGDNSVTRTVETLGWTDCECPGDNRWRNGVVLDPFGGSGTTLAVATGHGRDAIGIDLDERNADLARERVGMFLEVIDRPSAEPAA